MLTRNLLDVNVRQAVAKVGDEMHTLRGSLNGHVGTDTTREFRYQKIALNRDTAGASGECAPQDSPGA